MNYKSKERVILFLISFNEKDSVGDHRNPISDSGDLLTLSLH